jgi:hypothetical protein
LSHHARTRLAGRPRPSTLDPSAPGGGPDAITPALSQARNPVWSGTSDQWSPMNARWLTILQWIVVGGMFLAAAVVWPHAPASIPVRLRAPRQSSCNASRLGAERPRRSCAAPAARAPTRLTAPPLSS